MKKKIIYLICAILVLAAILFGYQQFINKPSDDMQKTITVEIIANGETIMNESFKTNETSLANFLTELSDKKAIVLDFQDSVYGMYIKGLGKDELFSEDPSKDMYWVYSSSNNASCLKDGFCPSASTLEIADQDYFVFELIKYE